MITKEELKQKCKEFEEREGRARFFNLAVESVDKYPIQASVIILATWNASRFRYMLSDPQNLKNLEEAIVETMPLFDKLEGQELKGADFDGIKDVVKKIYDIFSSVKGVEYTGGSKVMHLLGRDLFVMWDRYIRDHYGFGTSSEEYFKFQEKMQHDFRNISWEVQGKPLAKAIDEYNYVTITLPKL